MYAHIEGTVAEKTSDSIVLDAGGVGYLLMVSAQTLSDAPTVGNRMKLYCWLSVRKDALKCSASLPAKKSACLNGCVRSRASVPRAPWRSFPPSPLKDLTLALVAGDAQALTRAPGIGKKTAQRLVLELREKVEQSELVGAASAPGTIRQGPEAEAVAALMALGYASSEAARAIGAVAGKSEKVDELIFLALKNLGQ